MSASLLWVRVRFLRREVGLSDRKGSPPRSPIAPCGMFWRSGEGDRVVFRFTYRGTHKGDPMGIPPTGKQVTVTGIGIIRVENGKILEESINSDLMQQLGVTPTPGQPASHVCRPVHMADEELGGVMLPSSLWLQDVYSA